MATQGETENAKDDTLFYAIEDGGGYVDLAVDLSQFADDQQDDAGWTYEDAPASRFNVVSSWTIEAHVTTDNNDTGYLFSYASGANLLALSVNGSGSVQARLGAAVLGTLALPGLGGGAEEFVIGWSAETNLVTTGAGDALRSELRAFNLTDGSYAQLVITHVVRTAGTGDVVCWASDTGGSNTFTGTPHAIRISTGRFHPSTETHEDFVALTTTPSSMHARRIEFPVVGPGNDLAEPRALAGPVYAMGAASVRANVFRSLSPIVNIDYQERPTLAGDDFGPDRYLRAARNPIYTLLGSYVFYRPVPTFVDRVKVRVHVQQWRTSGTTNDVLRFRMWSLSRPPSPVADVVDQDEAVDAHYCDGAISTSHGSGAAEGEWIDLGPMRVSRNSAGCSWFALSVRVQDESGAIANTRFRIGAITIEPVVTE